MLRRPPLFACACLMLIAAPLSSCSKKPSPMAPANLTPSSTTPASGATNAAVATSFSATFTTPIDPSTATTSSFTIFRGATQVPGRVTVSRNTVRFTPLMPLETAADYVATVTTALKDQNGRQLAADLVWTSATESGTGFGGIVSSSTTLTLANSPYSMTSDAQINYGATLTIEPGVVVCGRGYKVTVLGNLAATGTTLAPITFHRTQIEPGSGLQPYVITIQHSLVDGGRIYDVTGHAVSGSIVLRDSKLYDLQGYMYLRFPVADCSIERNVFIRCGGVSTGTNGTRKVYVRNNVFYQQTGGYAVENGASYETSETVVALNSFLSTDRIALSLPAGFTSTHLTAINNFWGTTSTATIDAMIFDKNDDLTSNEIITYQPILTSPDAATPDATPWIPQVP